VENKVEIFKTAENQTEIRVKFDEETVWLNQKQLGQLFEKDSDTIGLHLKNIYFSGELEEIPTTEESSVVQKEGNRNVRRKIKFYNLDAIISVGYRVNSKRGIQFRQWATARLKDYLVQGYALNEKRLKQKDLKIETLKTGIRIINRALESEMDKQGSAMLKMFSKGLELLDDYDHEELDIKGNTQREVQYPDVEDYLKLVNEMKSDFHSGVFAKLKDESFDSSVNQIRQQFAGKELYPTVEEKAANLLYYITKNHSFVDGNKRIAAACFLYFLQQNNFLLNKKKEQIISNEALATLTLFIATSRSEESETVKRIIISILNRNNP
jgi:prophage maintenance system killer protein